MRFLEQNKRSADWSERVQKLSCEKFEFKANYSPVVFVFLMNGVQRQMS